MEIIKVLAHPIERQTENKGNKIALVYTYFIIIVDKVKNNKLSIMKL